MGKQKKVFKKCPHCHKTYELGVNGIIGSCDHCAHVSRDKDGFAWEPFEDKMTLFDPATDEIQTVNRKDRF